MSKKYARKDSPTSDVEEESETDYSSESDEGSEPSLFGNMRTRLRWNPADKTLNLDVRQYVQNRRKLELRCKGRLNTHSGQFTYTAQVQRIMSQNTPSLARIMAAERGIQLDDNQDIQPDRFLPAGLKCLVLRDWTMAPGLRLTTQTAAGGAAGGAAAPDTAGGDAAAGAVVPAGGSSSSSSSDDNGLRYFVTFRKQPQVLLRRGVWDSWLEGKADVELSSRGGGAAVGVRGALRLKVLRLNLTDKQDLQLALGADYCSTSSSSSSKADSSSDTGSSDGGWTPYVKLSENSWAVRLSHRALAFTYEI